MNKKIAGFGIGDTREFSVEILPEMIDQFIQLTGDNNPIHCDYEYAKKTGFNKPVVHGMLGASFISTLIGKHIPGEGALWLSQELNFKQAIRVHDILTFKAEVIAIHEGLQALTIKVNVKNQKGMTVMEGKSRVKKIAEKEKEETHHEKAYGCVVVTGAAGAIGSEVAYKMCKDGYPIVLAYNHNKTGCQKIADDIIKSGGQAAVVHADLRKEDSIKVLADSCLRFGTVVSGIVHCASAPIGSEVLSELNWDSVEEHIDVSARSLFNLARILLPKMVENNSGFIIAVTSQANDDAPPIGWYPYLAGKSVLEKLIHSISVEFGPKNIRANLISPGLIESDLTSDISERFKLVTEQQTPLRRLCRPVDVSNAVSFLAGDGAGFINGETLRLSGGKIIR